MARNINSAYRILEIVNQLRSAADKTITKEVWSDIFKITEKDQNKKSVVISRCLADLHDEVEYISSEMESYEFTSNLYIPSLNKCKTAFAIKFLETQWSQPKQQLSNEVPIVLGFLSEILPNEELLIEQSSLEELTKLAEDLRKTLKKSTLPSYAKSIIEKHLFKIEDALISYKSIGAKAFQEVMKSAYGEVIANEEIFIQAKGSKELGKLSMLWQKTKNVIDGVVSSNDRIEGVKGMAEKGIKLLEFIDKLNV